MFKISAFLNSWKVDLSAPAFVRGITYLITLGARTYYNKNRSAMAPAKLDKAQAQHLFVDVPHRYATQDWSFQGVANEKTRDFVRVTIGQ